MTKSTFLRILLIVGSALIIVGVTIITWMLATVDNDNVIRVELDDGKTQSVEIEDLCLIPGDQCEYKVLLSGDTASKYKLDLDFVETEEKTLKNFARVKIVANSGEVVYDELLATAFENDDIMFSIDLSQNKNTELTIVYYLPLEVGNEAKNAEAVFELVFTVTKE